LKAVLLVGGEGTRLRPLTCNTVKAMVPVLNRPFLEHMVRYLVSHGVDDIIVTLCYLPDRIRDYFGDGSRFGVRMDYVQEESPLGTAGAVKNAAAHLDSTFVVLNGDIFTELDVSKMIAQHRANKAEATIALTPVENPTAYGVVEIEDTGRIRRFVEKPPPDQVTSNLINAGVYVLEPRVLEEIPQDVPFMFEHHVFPALLGRGALFYGYVSDAYWLDIGTPEKYLKLNCDLLEGYCLPASGMSAQGSAMESSCVDGTAIIEGPVVMGTSCSIGPHVTLKGPVVLGDRCTVLEGATLEKVILWDEASVGVRAFLKGCVVGAKTRVGHGCHVGEGCIVGDGLSLADGQILEAGERVWPAGFA
jgi:mannose-1-phosphate guanylyltransferase